jgi:hypothetical protein
VAEHDELKEPTRKALRDRRDDDSYCPSPTKRKTTEDTRVAQDSRYVRSPVPDW